MKGSRLYFICLLLVAISCKKKDLGTGSIVQPEVMRVYDEVGIRAVTDLTSGADLMLITCLDEQSRYLFKLITNEGVELSTYYSDLVFDNLQSVQGILHNEAGHFDIFYGLDLYTLGYDGSILSHQPNFLGGLSDLYEITEVAYNADGNYILAGTASLSGNRAWVAAYDPAGNELYKRFFFINAQANQTYTSSVLLDDRSIMLAGTFESPGPDFSNAYFISKLSPMGEMEWTRVYNTTMYSQVVESGSLSSNRVRGRDLLETEPGRFLYFINPRGRGYPEQRITMVQFDEEGQELGAHVYLDFADINTSVGGAPYTGNVAVAVGNEKILGLSNPYYPNIQENVFNSLTVSYNSPQHTYLFELNNAGEFTTAEYANQDFNNYLTAIDQLSNGKIAMAGTIHSLGEELKLIILIR